MKWGYNYMNYVNNYGMKINIEDYTLTIEFAESKHSIVDRILNNQSGISTLLGNDDYYSCFMMIRYWKTGATNENEHGMVGVLYNTGGYVPHITAVPYQPAFLLGYNESIVMYNMSKNEVQFQRNLASPSFFCKCFKEGIVVLSELDITEITYSGDIIRLYPLDGIMTEHRFIGRDFSYKLDDGTLGKPIRFFESA